ncbi:MAG TPA: hypothetical protein VES42_02860, partial [Pilimelia sp.]|nr:hypothetical protein [Pilimelia sp.]
GVARAVRRGVTSGCACFGAAPGRFTRVHVARNALLLALAGATVASVASAGPVEVGPQLAVAVTGAVVAAAAFVFWDDLAAVVIGGPVDVERS